MGRNRNFKPIKFNPVTFVIDQQAKFMAKIEDVVLEVRDCMDTQAEYDAWWASTPDDNTGFFNAACTKLLELKGYGQPDFVQTYISGGEVYEYSPRIQTTQNIPF